LVVAFLCEFPPPDGLPPRPAPAEQVGVYGDPQRLVVTGTATIPTAAIRRALQDDFDVLLAAHPMGPLEAYAQTVRSKVLTGYRHEGFADARVSVQPNRDIIRLEVSVEEGPRCTAGDVKIVGLKTIDAKGFLRRLTEPFPPANAVCRSAAGDGEQLEGPWFDKDGKRVELQDPIWEPGEPAPFDRPTRAKLNREIKRALADFGRFFAEFTVDVVVDPDGQTAHLAVDVTNEGPEALLGPIEIVGNKRDDRQAVLDYLDLKGDTPLSADRLAEIRRRLWRSGRFVRSSASLREPRSPDEKIGLRIELTEYDASPPLAQTLSPEEEALLKLRDWLADADAWQSDMVIEAGWGALQLRWVYSPQQGAVMRIDGAAEGDAVPPFQLRFAATADTLALYSPASRTKHTAQPTRTQAVGHISLGVDEKPDDPTQPYRVGFGLGLRTSDDAGDRPLALEMNFSPCAFLTIAQRDGTTCTLNDGVLSIDAPDHYHWQIDAKTGRLIELTAPGEDGQTAFRVAFEAGAFGRLHEAIEAETKGYEDRFDAEYPVSSLLEFFCQEELLTRALDLDDRQRHVLGVVRRMLHGRALKPLDELVTSAVPSQEAEFEIPEDTQSVVQQIKQRPAALFVRLGLPYYGRLFPQDSWPWIVGREAAMSVVGQAQYNSAVSQTLYESEENGPLCYLATAALLKQASPYAARAFANRGLERLSLDDFRKEYRILLAEDYVVGQCIIGIAEGLRELDDEAAEMFDRALFDDDVHLLRDAARTLRRDPDRPVGEVLPEVFDGLWQGGLKDRIEAALRALRGESTPGAGEITRVLW